jgi:hypothetical protein
MTTFKEIRGTTIEVVSTDPTNPELGQIWYNSSSGTLKGYLLANVNAWASGGNLGTARYSVQGAGTQTAAVIFGGFTPFPGGPTGATELYNGTSWTSNPTSMGTPRYQYAASGTQTAALIFGGWPTGTKTATESFNGSTFSPTGSLSTGRNFLAGCGTQTSTLAFGGSPDGGTTQSSASESFTGSTWTNTPSMNTARGTLGGAGASNSSAIAFGGSPVSQGITTATESYNGTAWTTVNSMNTARRFVMGAGTQTAALAFGGDAGAPPYANQSATELWNGTTWTSNPTGLATARGGGAGIGTQALGFCAGGGPGSVSEEWTGSQLQTKTITVS